MENDVFVTVGKECVCQTEEKKSIFITSVFVVTSREMAQERVGGLQAKYPDATHHCYAYVLKSGYKRSNDDGEPSGTAGTPILNVIEHLGLCNTLVVITRYFGGIKLGAGGLVRAYSSSAAQALRCAGKSLYTLGAKGAVEVDYDDHALVERYLLSIGVTIIGKNFGSGVEITFTTAHDWDEIEATVTDMCRGGAICELKERIYIKMNDIEE